MLRPVREQSPGRQKLSDASNGRNDFVGHVWLFAPDHSQNPVRPRIFVKLNTDVFERVLAIRVAAPESADAQAAFSTRLDLGSAFTSRMMAVTSLSFTNR